MNNCFLLPRIWPSPLASRLTVALIATEKQLKQDKWTTNLTRLRKIFPPLLPQQEHGDKGETAHEMYHKATLAFDDVVPQPPNRENRPSLVFLIPYKFTPLLHLFYGRQTVLLVNSAKFCFLAPNLQKSCISSWIWAVCKTLEIYPCLYHGITFRICWKIYICACSCFFIFNGNVAFRH